MTVRVIAAAGRGLEVLSCAKLLRRGRYGRTGGSRLATSRIVRPMNSNN